MKFKHLGVAVPSINSVLSIYLDLLGYSVTSGPFDDPLHKVSVCFLETAAGDGSRIELVAPLGERSPVHQMLAKGITTYHLCYEVENLEQALQNVKEKNCIILSQPLPAVAFQGRRIAWFYTPNRQLVELLEQ